MTRLSWVPSLRLQFSENYLSILTQSFLINERTGRETLTLSLPPKTKVGKLLCAWSVKLVSVKAPGSSDNVCALGEESFSCFVFLNVCSGLDQRRRGDPISFISILPLFLSLSYVFLAVDYHISSLDVFKLAQHDGRLFSSPQLWPFDTAFI